jgi:hypothetical protein
LDSHSGINHGEAIALPANAGEDSTWLHLAAKKKKSNKIVWFADITLVSVGTDAIVRPASEASVRRPENGHKGAFRCVPLCAFRG